MKRIAIIPARGGSKRIPKKNIKEFCGKPMIHYPLMACQNAGLFNKIHVSTDDEEIASVVKDLGFSIDFMRPAAIADDVTGVMAVVKFVTEKYAQMGIEFDQIAMIMACSPLILSEDLQKAAEKLVRLPPEVAVLAVCSYPVPIEWAFMIGEDQLLHPIERGAFSIESQNITPKYFDAGVFAFFSQQRVLATSSKGDDSNFFPYEIPRERGVDIDTGEDWKFAEMLYKSYWK
jgi:pseudaminic acid cytidylyltransferase